MKITVISSQPYHDIRVRNYEADLTPVPHSAGGCARAGWSWAHHRGRDGDRPDVAHRDHVSWRNRYDRLVVALGSQVVKPDIPGLREFGFDVDTYDGAVALQRHLATLAGGPHTPAAATALVVGAGLTGIETACELPARLTRYFADVTPRVIVVDHNPHVGSDMGASARPVIEAALSANGVESRLGVRIVAVDEGGATLSTGETLARVDRRVVCGHAGQPADRRSGRRA